MTLGNHINTTERRETKMGILRKYRKNVAKSCLAFDSNMYTNILGSLVITHYILYKLEGKEVDVNRIKKQWKHICRKKNIGFWIDDKDFIPKALALFGMIPKYGLFAMCQSDLNVLFLPYLDGTVLPIREDGLYPMSAREGKIFPIKESEDTNKV